MICKECNRELVPDEQLEERVTRERDGRPVYFTPAQARVVAFLIAHEERLCPKGAIYDALYPLDMAESPLPKIIDVFVCKIRAKLHDTNYYIETIWGRGYRINRHEKEE